VWMLNLTHKQTISFLAFPHFSADIVNGVLTRKGGISSEPWASLNVGLGTGDLAENVMANRLRIKQGFGLATLVSCRQVHGSTVRVIERHPAGDLELADCDGLVTDLPGIGLLIQQADCQAVLLHDPVRRAIGIVHSGWRGSVANIIGAAIQTMTATYGTQPGDLLAGISPSLGPCCAEFSNYQKELPLPFHSYQERPHHFDFWAISRDQLRAAGVGPENIEIAGLCTVCCPDFFSYRREGVTGRNGSLIGLKEREPN
jgi:polyphenol oxidase